MAAVAGILLVEPNLIAVARVSSWVTTLLAGALALTADDAVGARDGGGIDFSWTWNFSWNGLLFFSTWMWTGGMITSGASVDELCV